MTLDAIDLDQQTIEVTGKASKTRTVFYSAKTGEAIDRSLRIRDKHRARLSDKVWLGGNGPLTEYLCRFVSTVDAIFRPDDIARMLAQGEGMPGLREETA